MRVIIISQKVVWVRHWFKWYRVQRGGMDWQSLTMKPRSLTLKEITDGLTKRKDSGLAHALKAPTNNHSDQA
jgi:hypothetical protein